MVGGLFAHIYYVSPFQINFLVPANLLPGNHRLYVSLDGLAGPEITIPLAEAAPGLFLASEGGAIATRAGGELATQDQPARPGDLVILYAAGLGQTNPAQKSGIVATSPAGLVRPDVLEVLLDGRPLPPDLVVYAGITPGFAGLYQLNLKLPEGTPADPTVRIRIGGQISPEGVRIPVRE
jgi:uncharacterized protein (TIGR03437 family)